jgi:hypothetical protein
MRSKSIILLIPLVIAASACETASGPVAPDVGMAASVTPAGVVASASGSAQRLRNGELWVLAFNAETRADGTTTGQARMDRKDANVSLNIDVTCLSVSGNTAWIGGIIRNQKGNIAIDGTVSYFYVIDNGEGAGSPPDMASAVRLNDRAGEDLAFCNNRPLLLAATPVEHGNVQVR